MCFVFAGRMYMSSWESPWHGICWLLLDDWCQTKISNWYKLASRGPLADKRDKGNACYTSTKAAMSIKIRKKSPYQSFNFRMIFFFIIFQIHLLHFDFVSTLITFQSQRELVSICLFISTKRYNFLASIQNNKLDSDTHNYVIRCRSLMIRDAVWPFGEIDS